MKRKVRPRSLQKQTEIRAVQRGPIPHLVHAHYFKLRDFQTQKFKDFRDSKEPWLYTWPTHVKFLKKEEDSYIKRGSIALGVFCKTKTVSTHARKIYVDHITSHAYANSFKFKKKCNATDFNQCNHSEKIHLVH